MRSMHTPEATTTHSRRRALSIMAAGAAMLLPGARSGTAAAPMPYRWQGIVLGAKAELTLYAADRGQAVTVIETCLAEVARLEAIFSLHRPDSALNRLNRAGWLIDPPVELVELLSQALVLSGLSGGRFDPTIQPLWRTIAEHFATPGANPAGPDAAVLAASRALVDRRGVKLAAGAIAFDRPGMQITLNGIAQGYVSDRIGDLLRARGFTHALVNLGETLAIDRRADGEAWKIGIPAPDDPSRPVETLELRSGAVATSAGLGLRFDATGRFNHIVDPTRLACADPDRGITVLAGSAAVADGLSTLGAMIPDLSRDFAPLLARFGARAYVVSAATRKASLLG